MYQPERIKAAQHQKTWVKLWTQHWGGSARVGNEIRNKAEGGNKIALKLFFWQVNLKKRRPAMIPERALETSTRIQNSRTDVPIQDLGSMCPNLTNFEYLWIQVAPEIPKNDWSKHIKTGAEAKILLETSDPTRDKTASPTQGPRFQSRQGQLLKTNRWHQKKTTQDPRVDNRSPDPKKVLHQNSRADSGKAKTLPETAARAHDSTVGSWKQELTPENGCPNSIFQNWILKLAPAFETKSRSQNSRIDSWHQVLGPLKTGSQTRV